MAWNYPTVAALAEHLADRLGLVARRRRRSVPTAAVGAADDPSATDDDSVDASHDDLEALLRDELAAVDRLLAIGRARS